MPYVVYLCTLWSTICCFSRFLSSLAWMNRKRWCWIEENCRYFSKKKILKNFFIFVPFQHENEPLKIYENVLCIVELFMMKYNGTWIYTMDIVYQRFVYVQNAYSLYRISVFSFLFFSNECLLIHFLGTNNTRTEQNEKWITEQWWKTFLKIGLHVTKNLFRWKFITTVMCVCACLSLTGRFCSVPRNFSLWCK